MITDEQQVIVLTREEWESIKERYEIHREFFRQTRDFLIQEGLESKFYDEFFPDSMILLERLASRV